MWIKLHPAEPRGTGQENVMTAPDPENRPLQLALPSSILDITGTEANLSFGLRSVPVHLSRLEPTVPAVGSGNEGNTHINTFATPLSLACPAELMSRLHLPATNVYQLQFSEGSLQIGPVIGLLLGEQQYVYHDSLMGEYTDAMSLYSRIGGLVVAFKSGSVDWEAELVYGLYYCHSSRKWTYGAFPLPTVVYRRAFNLPGDTVARLKEKTGGKVFNSRRYSKWQLYEKLARHTELKPCLPETVRLKRWEDFSRMFEEYPQIILKPIGLSRGRGICIIHRLEDGMVSIHDYNDGTHMDAYLLPEPEAEGYIREKGFMERSYIIQPYLKLAQINGSPWDIRVVMQKTVHGQWKCHGIECRVAGGADLVTNISRGGSALPIAVAVRMSFGDSAPAARIKKEVIAICTKLSESLEAEGETFAELGIDIAMDTDMGYWIIEANVRPTYNGFKRHMSYNNYLYLCSAPLLYASSLAGFQGGNRKHGS